MATQTAVLMSIAMILEDRGLGLVYVRILLDGRTEPFDACIGGDVASYLNRYHHATLVDTATFMEEWDRRRSRQAWDALQSVPSYLASQPQRLPVRILKS